MARKFPFLDFEETGLTFFFRQNLKNDSSSRVERWYFFEVFYYVCFWDSSEHYNLLRELGKYRTAVSLLIIQMPGISIMFVLETA